MTDVAGRIRYSGDLPSMRRLMFCLQEEGLKVTVESSEERRDIIATIEAILGLVGGVAGGLDLRDRIRSAIRKYREMNPGSEDKIEVLEPDDGGFLDE
jgi:hypothetical protein